MPIEGYCLTFNKHHFRPNRTQSTSKKLPGFVQNAVIVEDATWLPHSTLNIKFLDGSSDLQDEVMQYINEWQPHTGLTFKVLGRNSSQTEQVRISLTGQPGQFWSYIGQQGLNVSPSSATMHLGLDGVTGSNVTERKRLTLHEMGHTLGLVHEHQTSKSPIKFQTPQIYSIFEQQFGFTKDMVDTNVIKVFEQAEVSNSEFDPNSIMLYWFPPGTVTPPEFTNRVNNTLSERDKAFTAEMYEVDPLKRMRGLLLELEQPFRGATLEKGQQLVYKFRAEKDGDYRFETSDTDFAWRMMLFNYEDLSDEMKGDSIKKRSGIVSRLNAKGLEAGDNFYLVLQNVNKDLSGGVTVTARRLK